MIELHKFPTNGTLIMNRVKNALCGSIT